MALFFFVSNHKVSPSGKRKVIAVGSLDISDYIMEEPTSHDITVTLKPVKKKLFCQVGVHFVICYIGGWRPSVSYSHSRILTIILHNISTTDVSLIHYWLEPDVPHKASFACAMIHAPFCKDLNIPIYPLRRGEYSLGHK